MEFEADFHTCLKCESTGSGGCKNPQSAHTVGKSWIDYNPCKNISTALCIPYAVVRSRLMTPPVVVVISITVFQFSKIEIQFSEK